MTETIRLALSIEEAAHAAGIGRTALYSLLGAGEGPRTFRVGRRRLIRRAALSEWLRQLELQNEA